MSHPFRSTIGFVVGFVVISTASADADAEHEALAGIIHELKVVSQLVHRAQNHADNDARIQFRYDWLAQDLKRIRDGIQAHIDAPRAQPRTVTPLRGDYRR